MHLLACDILCSPVITVVSNRPTWLESRDVSASTLWASVVNRLGIPLHLDKVIGESGLPCSLNAITFCKVQVPICQMLLAVLSIGTRSTRFIAQSARPKYGSVAPEWIVVMTNGDVQ